MNTVHATVPLRVDVQIAADESVVPNDADWQTWVGAALRGAGRDASGVVTVRLVSEDESAALNLSYRDKPGPTNILAFPGPGDELTGPQLSNDELIKASCNAADAEEPDMELGDLVICLPIACREAVEQGKRPVAHLAHLTVHGTLHLIGYDHQSEAEAERMESLETRVLGGLGITDPYAEQTSNTV